MIRLEPNSFLLRQGDLGNFAFLIEQGSVEIVLEQGDGEKILAVLGPGEIVGEMALVDQALRSASVRAREACSLLPITAEQIGNRLGSADPILRLILSSLLERLRATLRDMSGDVLGHRAPLAVNDRLKAAAAAELRIEQELDEALEGDQIQVYYQPIVRLATGALTGFEALARWHHPRRGVVPPTTFIPVAEVSGRSSELARVITRRIRDDIPAIQAANGDEELCFNVNISGHDLVAPGFIADLAAVFSANPSVARQIVLELTETILLDQSDEAVGNLKTARSAGFRIAVDDFGSGYSGLSHIRTLPLDIVKIDKSFIQGMIDCATTHSIVESMQQLAKSLQMATIGEGIETRAELAAALAVGCDFGQGYLFGRPLPIEDTLAAVRGWSRLPLVA